MHNKRKIYLISILTIFLVVYLVFLLIAYNKIYLTNHVSYIESEVLSEMPQTSILEEAKSGFYWAHMPITYKIENEKACGKIQSGRIKLAFQKIEEETLGSISFKETDDNEDITISCYAYAPSSKVGYVTFANTEVTEIADNIISKAKIKLYNASNSKRSGGCVNYPDVEIHEILHAFGYSHQDDSNSIMHKETRNCRTDLFRIDDEIVNELKNTYPDSKTQL